jgi:hypothetical protein
MHDEARLREAAARPFSSSVRTNPVGGASHSPLRHWGTRTAARPDALPCEPKAEETVGRVDVAAASRHFEHAGGVDGSGRALALRGQGAGDHRSTAWRVQRRVLRALMRTDRARYADAMGMPPPGVQQLLKRWQRQGRPMDFEDDEHPTLAWREASRRHQLAVRHDRARCAPVRCPFSHSTEKLAHAATAPRRLASNTPSRLSHDCQCAPERS